MPLLSPAFPGAQPSAVAYAVNDYADTNTNLVIGGTGYDGSYSYPVVWVTNGSGIFSLVTLAVGSGVAGDAAGEVLGVNANGDAVGWTKVRFTVTVNGTPTQYVRQAACKWTCTSQALHTYSGPTILGGYGVNSASQAQSINNAGDIVGYSYLVSNLSATTGFLYKSSTWITLPSAYGTSGDSSKGMAINNNGVICGRSRVSADGGTGATVWSYSGSTITGSYSCGHIYATDPPHAGYYGLTLEATALTDAMLNNVVVTGLATAPAKLNPAGVVVGGNTTYCFYWTQSAASNWFKISAGQAGGAYGINNAGRIVGSNFGNIYPSAAWYTTTYGSTYTTLVNPFTAAPPDGNDARVYAVNNSNIMVGFMDVDADGRRHAGFWK